MDQILPTTMIGSYPKPRWYTRYNLAGADLLEWWKRPAGSPTSRSRSPSAPARL